jgi:redox-sensitive bicupin YhaK (pirin superfamily)
VYAGLFDGSESATLDIAKDRWTYVHVARGSVQANGTALNAGDALKLKDEGTLVLGGGQDAEVIVFDLPGKE